MYQETSKDTKLRFSYGELDLGWLRELHSPELVVSLVRYASEVGNLKKVVVGEIFKAAGHESISLSDHDVGVSFQDSMNRLLSWNCCKSRLDPIRINCHLQKVHSIIS